MRKIGAIMWASHMPALAEAAALANVVLRMVNVRDLEDLEKRECFFQFLKEEAEGMILFPSTGGIWEELESQLEKISGSLPTAAFGYDPGLFRYHNLPAETGLMLQRYLTMGGVENSQNALRYFSSVAFGDSMEDVAPPEEIPWQGIYEPGNGMYEDGADYMERSVFFQAGRPTVGILFYRHLWLNGNTEVIDALQRELGELGYNVVAVFGTGRYDAETGSKDNKTVMERYFFAEGTPIIDLLVNLQSFFLMRGEEGADFLKKLNVPILKGLLTYGRTEEEWRNHPYGLTGPGMVMSVAMPEVNGVIEPVVVACLERVWDSRVGGAMEYYHPLTDRIIYLCRRVEKWIVLQKTPLAHRKVAVILHNSPCHGVELSVGGAANLDSLESVARIMERLQAEGYTLKNAPKNGEELIQTIMGRKAISDFRWTSVGEIVAKGGVLRRITSEEYKKWFIRFPEKVQREMIETWGNPPGEEKDGVPAAMVDGADVLVTGIDYGNVVVCAQPKRGCAGARCDGQVCKILHDPECPPTHQYVATYRYLEEIWGAHMLLHVGTHGNLEFLPGKSLGLSETCYPELTLGTMPHLYIYNTDNPPEGTIAKRRSYATLVGHMQTVMKRGEKYGVWQEIGELLGEYRDAALQDPARAHMLEHLIREKTAEANLTDEFDDGENSPELMDFSQLAEKLHGVIGAMGQRMYQDGLHIFGTVPEGERKTAFIQAVLRHDQGEGESWRALVADLMGLKYELLRDLPHVYHEEFGATYGELAERVDHYVGEYIAEFIGQEQEGGYGK